MSRWMRHLQMTVLATMLASHTVVAAPLCSAVFDQVSSKWNSISRMKVVDVTRGTELIRYERTNRNLEALSDTRAGFYPSELLNLNELQGQRILDAGCGDGAFVNSLRARKIDAVGIDIRLRWSQKLQPSVFREGDLTHTNYPPESFGVIYSTYSVFYYEQKSPDVMENAVVEMKRILKPGGSLRISPFFGADKKSLSQLRAQLEANGFQTRVLQAPRQSSDGRPVLVLEAIRG